MNSLFLFLSIVFALAGVATLYIWGVRPIIKERGYFPSMFAQEESFLARLSEWTQGFRTRLVAKALMIGSMVLAAQDSMAPFIGAVDWTPVTEKIPRVAWPFILFGVAWGFDMLRKVTTGPVGEQSPPAPPPAAG